MLYLWLWQLFGDYKAVSFNSYQALRLNNIFDRCDQLLFLDIYFVCLFERVPKLGLERLALLLRTCLPLRFISVIISAQMAISSLGRFSRAFRWSYDDLLWKLKPSTACSNLTIGIVLVCVWKAHKCRHCVNLFLIFFFRQSLRCRKRWCLPWTKSQQMDFISVLQREHHPPSSLRSMGDLRALDWG